MHDCTVVIMLSFVLLYMSASSTALLSAAVFGDEPYDVWMIFLCCRVRVSVCALAPALF